MERYMTEQRAFIVEQYFKNNECLAATVGNFRTKYGWNSDLTSSTVKKVIEKVRQTGSVGDAKHINAGQAVNVIGARYRDVLTQLFLPKFVDIEVDDSWFQLDEATCHTARATIQLVH
ncbi:hypothetical protein NPIL_525631 [Nephila pilipes]|uniref:DUF4817 domain-containing protein n=1 Tax=Nephila pilipes TaxID=299642 RepID=A0A8X6PJ20_NEPPI|nr:hypothetical protein NPIL_525631 [Nephila pilipes]